LEESACKHQKDGVEFQDTVARGRMISKSLSTSAKFANLSATTNGLSEFCQVLYVMLIPHTDDFGRLQGDAFTIKHQCFPASPRSVDEFKSALLALHNAELIIWYQVSGKQFVQITNFDPHQVGLHKRTHSVFPEFPGISGNLPEFPKSPNTHKEKKERYPKKEEKGTELKGSEGKGTELKGSSRTATEPPSDVPDTLEYYCKGYMGRFHEKPNINGPKDGKLLKTLLRQHGRAAVRQRIDNMLHSLDPFIQGTGCTIGILSSQWNKLRSTASATGKLAGNAAAVERFISRKPI
jgi:hypothetical protein